MLLGPRSRRFATFGVVLLALVANGPVVQSANDGIVVVAPSHDQETLRHQIGDFVRKVSDAAEHEQFARRNQNYCPEIIGLPQPYDGIVLSKLAAAAEASRKVRRNSANCKPDIFIVFTDDSNTLMKKIKTRNADFFGSIARSGNPEAYKPNRAIQWWYGTEINGSGGEPPIDGTIKRTNASLVSSGIKISMTSTLVVVDVTRAKGYPLDSLASYVAMVSFAMINGRSTNLDTTPSILGIFSRSGPRLNALRDLTVWDKAYLQALYKMPPDRPFWQQRLRLKQLMINALNEIG